MGIDNHQPGRPATPPRVEAPNVPPADRRAPADAPTPPRDGPPPRHPWDTLVHAADLHGRMERQPHQTLLIAFAVGFVASGALFTRFSARALGLAFRVVALPLLESALTPTASDRAARG